MINWDEAQTICQDLGADNSSSTLTVLKRFMNLGYKLVLAEINRPVIEKTNTSIVTVASQQYYDMPMDMLFPKSISLTIDGVKYPIVEEESQENWDYLNTNPQYGNIPEKFFVRPNFGIGHCQIGIYPIPTTADYAFTVVYEVMDKNLTVDKYTTGTIALTNADKTATITTGTFTAAMVGRYIKGGDGFYYKIASYTDANNVEMEHAYEGTTDAAVTTEISEMFALPEEMQILPCYFALAHFFAIKKDSSQETKYWTLYNAGIEAGKRRWGTKSRSSITRGNGMGSRFQNWGPGYFPNSITS